MFVESKRGFEIMLPLHKLLINQPKEKLVNLLLELSEQDSMFEFKLRSRFDDAEDSINVSDTVEVVIDSYKNSHHFINYYEVMSLADDLEDVLNDIEKQPASISKGENILRFMIAVLDVIEDCDDSSGSLHALEIECINLLSEISEKFKNETDKLDRLIETYLKYVAELSVFEYSEAEYDVLEVCVNIATTQNQYKAIHKALILATKSKQAYHYQMYMALQLKLVKRFDNDENIELFIDENLHLKAFKKAKINQLKATQKYEEALQLIEKAQKEDEKNSANQDEWKEIACDIYKQQGDTSRYAVLTKELFLGGSTKYYQALKDIHQTDKGFYENLKHELKNLNRDYLYAFVINKENDVVALLDYVKQHPETIEKYKEKLLPTCERQVVLIYEAYILDAAQYTTKRSEYQDICGLISRYQYHAPLERVNRIVAMLRETYKRRPAFVDELKRFN